MKRLNELGIVLISLLTLSLLSFSYAAPWEDFDQEYRQEINLSGATSTITNYTTEITIDSSIVGSNFNFSQDRNSLRFYYFNSSLNTNTLIAHYAQQWNNITQTATIILKVPELNNVEDSPVWMYYGDTMKSNSENYCDVFLFCDLFEDGTINNGLLTTDQDLVGGTTFSEGSGVLSITAGGADTWTGQDDYGSVYIPDIEGDVDIQLEVTSSTSPNVWTKVGVMLKNDMTARASSTGYHFMARTPGNRYSFQSDTNDNGFLDSNTNTIRSA